jgi:hypothetical protein
MRARSIARWICLGYLGLLIVCAVAVGSIAAYDLIADPDPGAPSLLGRWSRVVYSLRQPYVLGLLGASAVSIAIGAVVLRGLARGRRLAHGATAAIAVVMLAGLYQGTVELRTIEGRFYKKSRYVKGYLTVGYPLAGASILGLAAGLFGALPLRRKEQRPEPPATQEGG